MKTAYKNDMPILKLRVKGSRGETEYDAYLDTGAGRTLIPEKDAKKWSHVRRRHNCHNRKRQGHH